MLKKIAFTAITLSLAFLLTEALLRLSSLIITDSPLAPKQSLAVKDSLLGHRFRPDAPGHDRLGFRNDTVPAKADIVILGDSQTYGAGVARVNNWPSFLQKQTGAEVYNMALGGWGPVESMFLLEEALRFEPGLVIEAIYSGNDFYDCFNAVYYRLDLDSLKTVDPELAAAIDSAEQVRKYSHTVAGVNTIRRQQRREGQIYYLKNWLYANVYTYRLLSITKSKLLAALPANSTADSGPGKEHGSGSAGTPAPDRLVQKRWQDSRSAALLYPENYLVFDDGSTRTILTPGYRFPAVNLSDPRTVEGMGIALRAIDRISDRLKADDIPFLVVLIPTKELVFSPLVDKSTTENEPALQLYRQMIDHERRIWETVKTRLDSAGISWVDGLDCLRQALEERPQPYMVTENGHPDIEGHRALARCVARFLR